MPDSGFPTNLRSESREFCYSFTAVFEGKKMERGQMFVLGPPNKVDLFESGVEPDRPTEELADRTT